MKYFKRIALLILAAVSAVCIGVFAAACDNGNKAPSDFTVTVCYSDGETPVNGTDNPLIVQICLENDKISFCSTKTYNVDNNGKVKINIADVNAEADAVAAENGETLTDSDRVYILHVLKIGEGQLETKDEAHVSKANPEAKIVLKNVIAP